MYTLKITNQFPDTIELSGGGSINSGDTGEVEELGNFLVTIPGVGQVRFFDLGEKKLPNYENYPTETWGVLIRFQTTEAYYRYEGGGAIDMEIDAYGSIAILSAQGTIITIKLPELTIKEQ